METEDAVCLMTSIALIVLSIQYRRGRWLCSIAGYDVTKRESEIDIRPYAKLISSVTLWMGLLFFLWAVEDWVRDWNTSVFEVLVLLLFSLASLSSSHFRWLSPHKHKPNEPHERQRGQAEQK